MDQTRCQQHSNNSMHVLDLRDLAKIPSRRTGPVWTKQFPHSVPKRGVRSKLDRRKWQLPTIPPRDSWGLTTRSKNVSLGKAAASTSCLPRLLSGAWASRPSHVLRPRPTAPPRSTEQPWRRRQARSGRARIRSNPEQAVAAAARARRSLAGDAWLAEHEAGTDEARKLATGTDRLALSPSRARPGGLVRAPGRRRGVFPLQGAWRLASTAGQAHAAPCAARHHGAAIQREPAQALAPQADRARGAGRHESQEARHGGVHGGGGVHGSSWLGSGSGRWPAEPAGAAARARETSSRSRAMTQCVVT